ncbi:hypothetical protein OC846_003323 [Tilletia horrida]|uniref:Zn(2)-C6 fungal-type domain-containing protein n=1 Tax=Tilletia horrida TaxID=155126 RepID=A0AAN6JRE7_9BASI|nr:hypothetical protein OC846_003323 [Tilletia horrida]
MPAPHLPTAAVPHTPRKRSRKPPVGCFTKACDNCRRHKCKCEPEPHHKSICAQCYMLGQDCTYNDESKKRGPPKGYIEAIETRVHHMERILADLFHSDLPEAQALLDKMLSKAVQDDIRSGKIVLCRHNDPSRRPAQRSNTGGKWKQSWWTAPLNRETDPAAAAAAAQAEASASMSAEPLFPSVLHASGSTISNVAPSGVPMLPAWERPRRFPNTEIQWTSMTNPMGIPPALGQEHAWPNSRLVLAQGDQVAVEQACPSAAPSQTSFSSLVVQYPTSPDAYSTQFYGAGAFPYSQYSTTPVDSTRAPSRDLSESPSVAMNGIRLLPAGPPPISTFGCQQMGQTITESGQVADVLTTGSKRKHGTAFQANFGPSSADLAAIPAPMPLNPIPKLFELKYPRLVFGDTGSSGRPRVLEATSGAGPQLAADSHPEVHLESSQETHGTLLQDAAGGGDALPTPEATPITSSQPFIEICVPPPPESAAARDPTASPEAAQSLEADLQEPAIN